MQSKQHTVTGGSTFDSAMRHPRGGLTVDIELQDSSVSRVSFFFSLTRPSSQGDRGS
jgi:hypothetical protein